MSTSNSIDRQTQGYGGASFQPMAIDVDTLEPDVYPGPYQAKCTAATAKLSAKGKPMIELEWKMTSTESEEETAQKSIGATKRDWIVFAGGRGGNFGKLKLRAIRDAMGLDADVIPTQLSSLEDLKPLCQAIRQGGEIPVWVLDDTKGNEGDTRLEYAEPRGTGALAPMQATSDADEEEAPEETEAPAPKASTKGKASAKARR